jgi:hypothetical protein
MPLYSVTSTRMRCAAIGLARAAGRSSGAPSHGPQLVTREILVKLMLASVEQLAAPEHGQLVTIGEMSDAPD